MGASLKISADYALHKERYCHISLMKSLKMSLFARFLVELNETVINFSKTLANVIQISIIAPTDTATAAQYAL